VVAGDERGLAVLEEPEVEGIDRLGGGEPGPEGDEGRQGGGDNGKLSDLPDVFGIHEDTLVPGLLYPDSPLFVKARDPTGKRGRPGPFGPSPLWVRGEGEISPRDSSPRTIAAPGRAG